MSNNFIEDFVEADLESGKHKEIITRFPPEPNGYLHIGHAKAICISFGIGEKYKGKTNLRFDDTNPLKEDTKYVEAIKKDIAWLGFKWNDEAVFTSDYFETLYKYAIKLIKDGKAYVDDSSKEEMAKMRGIPTEPGTESPYRNRTIEENLELFEKMKNGVFEAGSKVLRAKIDMTSPNMHMRDPVIYRILNQPHHRTGDKWNIYPMYDFAHGQSDSIEGITHSLCSLEFENHRPLYNWFIENLEIFPSRQIEFSRLHLNYTVMSKRKLLQLVEDKLVNGWDDPRMPTISGLRRRGYTPKSIRNFCERIGVTKKNYITDVSLLEDAIRQDLNQITPRVMAVLEPLKVIITNYPEEKTEELEATNNPNDPESGTRLLPFSRKIYIERSDFLEEAPKKFFRLKPDGYVRLKNAYIIQCQEIIKNEKGEIEALHCQYFPESKSGSDTSGIKTKGVIHWVSIKDSLEVDINLYDRLFLDENPLGHEGKDFKEFINPNSLKKQKAMVEPNLKNAKPGDKFQFMRQGYFCVDDDSSSEKLIFNRTVTLRDAWAKIKNQNGKQKR